MKTLLLSIIISCCFGMPLANAQTPDEEALKKLVREETESYMKRDTAAWKALFVQDEGTTRLYTGNGVYYNEVGWKKFSQIDLKWMKENPKPSKYTNIKHSNFIIKQSGNLASMVYEQQLSTPNIDTLPGNYTREFRTLVKENDRWKISSITTIDTLSFTSAKPEIIENVLNGTGYNFLNAKKINEAIEVFKLNVKLYPKAWNTYDSLGEAYAAAGNKTLAIENYEKSIKLNPKNDNGIAVLVKLKKK